MVSCAAKVIARSWKSAFPVPPTVVGAVNTGWLIWTVPYPFWLICGAAPVNDRSNVPAVWGLM